MSRACKYILGVFFLAGAIAGKFAALAEEVAAERVIARPVMEYASAELRDPFRTYLIKEPRLIQQENKQGGTEAAKPELDLSKLKVQGIIWGGSIPQAIINNQVLTNGVLIEGAEILSIEKKGVTLSFNGLIYNLSAPGQSSVQTEKIPVK